MAYDFKLPQQKISIDTQEIDDILKILTATLQQNNVNLAVVSDEEHQKQGIWFGLIVKKFEDLTGEKHGTTIKILSEMNLKLDSFAYKLIEEFQNYIAELLKAEGVKSAQTTKKEISNKYVLISEILIRLLSHTLSSEKTDEEGYTLLSVTQSFIKELHANEIMLNKSFGSLELSKFSNSLIDDFDGWIKLMRNSVNVTDLLHKNTKACNKCFQLLNQLKKITQRQIAVFLNSEKEIDDYADRCLNGTFNECLKEFDILDVNKLIASKYPLSFKPDQFNPDLYTKVYEMANKSKLCQNKNKLKIVDRICFLAEIEAFQELLNQMSIVITMLGWLPALTGTLDVSDFCSKLKVMSIKATTILNTNTCFPTGREKMYLSKYNSNTVGDINLFNGFSTAVQQLEDLSKPEKIAELLQILEISIDSLIELQEKYGFNVLNKDNLSVLYKTINMSITSPQNQLDNTTPMIKSPENQSFSISPSLEKIASTNKAKPPLKFFRPPISKPQKALSSNPFDLDNMPEIPTANETQLLSKEILNSTPSLNTKDEIHSNPCYIQTTCENISHNHTYVINKSNPHWHVQYFLNPQTVKPKTLEITQVYGLGNILNSDVKELNDELLQKIQAKIILFHIREQLFFFETNKCYEQGLKFISTNQEIINQDNLLKKYSLLCESNFYIGLAQEASNKLIESPDESTIFITRQAIDLNRKQKKMREYNSEQLKALCPIAQESKNNDNEICRIS